MPKRKFYSEEMRDVHIWTSALYEIVHASVYNSRRKRSKLDTQRKKLHLIYIRENNAF